MARKLNEILVVDVESKCWDGLTPDGEESKPVKSLISDFCSDLTTLQTEMFANAGTFADACRQLKKEFEAKERLWASWGDNDRRQFERCCLGANVG